MSLTVIDKLYMAREVAWARLRPAFDHAISLAKEAEYVAEKATVEAQSPIKPVYPPLVLALADSADGAH